MVLRYCSVSVLLTTTQHHLNYQITHLFLAPTLILLLQCLLRTHLNFPIHYPLSNPNDNHARVSIQVLHLQGNSHPRAFPLQAIGLHLLTRRHPSLASSARRLRGTGTLERRRLVGGPTGSMVRRRDCRSPREFQFRTHRRRRPQFRRFQGGVLGRLQFGDQFPDAQGDLQGAR